MTTPQPAPVPTPDAAMRPLLLRSASIAWMGSAVVIFIGGVILAVWVYTTIRQQQSMSDAGYASPFDTDGGDGVSLLDRLDLGLANVYFLAEAGLLVGAGCGLRILGDLAAARAGGPARPEMDAGPTTEIVLERDDDASG